MSDPMMTQEEFIIIADKLKGGRGGWIDRVSDLTGIDKPTLSKYATGDRKITLAHGLFLRMFYFLQSGFPDLANDMNFMIRGHIDQVERYPTFNDVKDRAVLTAEIKKLEQSLNKIRDIANTI